MPGSATVIGRVAVKVVPDTDDFRGEAQRELTAIEAALDNIKIEFEANLSEVRREADRAVDAAQEAAKRKTITLRIDLANQDEIKRGIASIDKELDRLKERTEIKVNLNEQELRETRDHLRDELEKADPSVRVRLNQFAHRKALGQMAYLARTRTAQIVPHVNKAAAAKVGATLAALSGGRAFKNIATDVAEWVGGLDKAVPAIATTSLAVTNLAGYALSATSNLTALGGSLASIGGSALALPGIFGGLAIGVGASIAVLKDFNKVLPGVGDRLHDLQDSMSTGFWKEAEEPFRNFINEIFPQFRAGMEDTSSALGGFFANLADSATGMFDGELQAMFDDLSRSIDIAGKYTDNFLSVIQQLGEVGAGNLPKLAKWFGEITADFDGWLQRKGPEGLQQFIDDGVAALQDLGGVLSATGSMFAGLARAAEAAGGSTLAIMRETMEGVAEVVNGPKFQNALIGTFRAAHEGMSEIANGAGQQFQDFILRLGDTLESVLPSAGRAAGEGLGAIFDALDQPVVQKAAIGLFENLEQVVSNLAPSMPGVAKALAAIADTVGDLAVNLSRAIGAGLDVLAPAVVGLSDDLDPLIDQLGDLLVNAVEGAAPVVAHLADVLGDVAGTLAAVLKPINGLMDAFGDLPGPIQSAAGYLVTIGLLVGGGAWFGTAVRGKIAAFGGAMTIAGRQATIAQGAFFKAGAAAQGITSRMTGMRSGLAVGALALTGLASDAAGSNKALGAVASVGGAALTGFFVGGPWGAAIGGAVGALSLLIGHAKDGSDAADQMKTHWEGLKDTLNEVTGATEEATRAFIYDELSRKHVFSALGKEGIARRTVVDAILGEKGAVQELSGVLDDQQSKYDGHITQIKDLKAAKESLSEKGMGENAAFLDEQIKDLEKKAAAEKALIDAIKDGTNAVENDTKAQRKRGTAVTDFAKLFEGDRIPRQVITHFEAKNLPKTARGMAKLATQFKGLNGKKIKAIIEAADLPFTMRQVKKFLGQLDDVDRKNPEPKITLNTKPVLKDLKHTDRELLSLGNVTAKPKVEIDDKATRPTADAKGKVQDFGKTNAAATVDIVDHATSKIRDIQTALSSLNGNTATVTTYHRDVFSTKSGGGSQGTSPRMIVNPGAERAAFLTRVMDFDVDDIAKAALKLANSISLRVRDALQQKANVIAEKYKQIIHELGNQGDKEIRKRFNNRVIRFEKDRKELNDLLDALGKAKARVEAIRAELANFRKSVMDSFMAAADPTAMEVDSYGEIIRGLEAAKIHADRFKVAIDKLIKQGLNDSTLKQIITAGPEAGLAAAEAIAEGGVKTVNDLQAGIEKAAGHVGHEAGNALFDDLLRQANGRVRELVKAIRPLERRLRHEARRLVDALTDELKDALEQSERQQQRRNRRRNRRDNRDRSPRTNPRIASVPRSVDATDADVIESKTLNYYAAPGSAQLSAEEELFAASDRGRMTFP